MAAKFIKQDDKWMVEITCTATGTKSPEVGDIFSIKGRKIKVIEVIKVTGESQTYGCKTLVNFKNF
jgi:hypothetical protein